MAIATIIENFNRSNRVLDTGPSGIAPQAISGTANITSNRLTFSQSHTTNPFVVWDAGTGEIQVKADVGLADAVYFRVVDINNWWRARVRSQNASQTTSFTEYERREIFYQYRTTDFGLSLVNSTATFHNWYPNRTQTSPSVSDQTTSSGFYYVLRTSTLTGRTRQNTSTSSYTIYRVVLEGVESGIVRVFDDLSVGSLQPIQLRVLARGSLIEVRYRHNLGLETLAVQVSSALFATATKHGVGRGGPTTGSTSAGIDNVEIIPQVRPPTAPTIQAPVNGQYVDATEQITVIHRFNDPDLPLDWETAHLVRIREDGGSNQYLNAAGTALTATITKRPISGQPVMVTLFLPPNLLANGHIYQLAISTWDAQDQPGALSPEVLFNTQARPQVLVLEPEPNEVLDGTTLDVLYDYVGTSAMTWIEAWVESLATGEVVAATGRFFPGGDEAPLPSITGLPATGAFLLRVQVADLVGMESNWATVPFTINARPPTAPVVEATDLGGDVLVEVQLLDNLLTENQADLEFDLEGVEADVNATVEHVVGTANTRLAGVEVEAVAAGPASIVWDPVAIRESVRYGSRLASTYVDTPTLVRLKHRYLDGDGRIVTEPVGEDVQQLGGGVNQPPIAALTGPTSLKVGDAFQLDATGSMDPEGGALTFAYSQVLGATVTLGSATTPTPTGTAPAAAGTITFRVTVTDPEGAEGEADHSIVIRPAGAETGGGPGTNASGDLDTAGAESRLVADANVLWSLNFDRPGSTLDAVLTPAAGRVHYNQAQNSTIATPPEPVTRANGTSAASGQALRGVNPFPNPAGVDRRWGFDHRILFEDMGVAGQTTAYFRYYVFFPAAYEWTRGVLPGLMGVRPGYSPWTPAGGTALGETSHDPNQWSAGTMWQPDRSMVTYLNVVHAAGVDHVDNISSTTGQMFSISARYLTDASATTPSSDGTRITLVDGWNCIEQRVTLNTAGSNDGIFQGWINGVLGINLTDVQYRATGRSDVLIDEWRLAWFHGSDDSDEPTREAEVFLDDFVISKAAIGQRTD